MKEPRHAVDYEDRGARAVRSVLLELGGRGFIRWHG